MNKPVVYVVIRRVILVGSRGQKSVFVQPQDIYSGSFCGILLGY